MRVSYAGLTGPCFAAMLTAHDPAPILRLGSPAPEEDTNMMLTIYGNRLSPDAPANLQVDVQGLEKLYGLADVNGHGQVAPLLIATPVVEE